MKFYNLVIPEENINTNYIEKSLKSYIKKNNFPKKLVLNKIKNDVEKRKELETKLKTTKEKISNEIVSMDKKIESLKIENERKIKSLLTTFSNDMF